MKRFSPADAAVAAQEAWDKWLDKIYAGIEVAAKSGAMEINVSHVIESSSIVQRKYFKKKIEEAGFFVRYGEGRDDFWFIVSWAGGV